ncbi:aldehyde dehydrogenase family protein [Micromonospora sp. NPDC048871]|uniref:aldehyde dehydrogenase family protein n=1 Tax=unclassified Micromonospora TaxID=2617518 RepID=UPI002E0F68E9|nr:aldehyde dehydrogenase family protein [Micromonospora sp. NBC_01739]
MSAVHDPRTGEVVGHIPLLTSHDVPEIAHRATAALPGWSAVPVDTRCAILTELARLIAARPAHLGTRFALETGKTLAQAEAELDRAAATFGWTAAAATEATAGRTISGGDGLHRQVLVDPVGPVLAILASNFPAVILARKLAPALAMGCTVVVKAPETTPSVVREIADLAAKAGLPADVLQVVFTDPVGSAALVARPEFPLITFTGSHRTGQLVAAEAAGRLADCVLELGGHAPAILLDDADLATAVPALVSSKFSSAGQSCAAPSRFLVHERIHAEFVDRFSAAVPDLDHRPGGTMGPLHTEARRDEVHTLVRDAVERGATVITGGRVPPGPGWYYPATVLTDVPAESRLLHEEPFGPIAPVLSFTDEDQAVATANGTPFGLGAFVFGDQARATALARRLNVGRVSVNCATGADPMSPLSGRGLSGYGYEGGLEGLAAFGRLKVIQQPL